MYNSGDIAGVLTVMVVTVIVVSILVGAAIGAWVVW